ncbi:immunoglobulin lambda-1 light chain-like [Centropristis striata]|uniref:immunoglobulin lambda-1 light chain-like n=1 Tax=Centropristis striata TaxID=184440 RepID=UPI0027E204A3|nr:immunoglobulin lambda-1 light chain-like [Centropristis striata]
MLFLPAAALCCLCSALAAMATQLLQEDLTWTRRVGERVSFSCRGTGQCNSDYVLWYQKRDTETFTLILHFDRSDGTIGRDYNHPQEDDFSAVNKQNGSELQIQSVKLNHSATYYCCCGRNKWIFGSGTKLFVVDQQVVKPVVSVYPAAPRAHLEGKSSLLCLASAMFPPLVRFSWKRRKENGPLEELPPAEGEQLELRESGRTAAILLLRQQESSTYKYRCYVQHEGGQVEAPTEQEVPAPAASCPPEREPADLPALEQADWSFQSQCRVKLLCLLYTVLIVKSLVFCCGLSLLMILRNKGPSTNCTHAD